MARRGLGKGLDTLISAEAVKPAMKEETGQAETTVKITKVEPNREQPRKNFDEERGLKSD